MSNQGYYGNSGANYEGQQMQGETQQQYSHGQGGQQQYSQGQGGQQYSQGQGQAHAAEGHNEPLQKKDKMTESI